MENFKYGFRNKNKNKQQQQKKHKVYGKYKNNQRIFKKKTTFTF